MSLSWTSHSISSKLFSAFVQVAKRNTTFCPNQIKSYIIHRKRQGYESITTGNVRARARVTLGNMFDTIRNLCANMLLAATADLLRSTLFHFVGGRRYLQCFAASSSAAKTRGIGRTRTDDRGRRESEKEANILQLQRRPYKTYPQAERILVRVMWACWNCPPFEREREYCGVCYRVTMWTDRDQGSMDGGLMDF